MCARGRRRCQAASAQKRDGDRPSWIGQGGSIVLAARTFCSLLVAGINKKHWTVEESAVRHFGAAGQERVACGESGYYTGMEGTSASLYGAPGVDDPIVGDQGDGSSTLLSSGDLREMIKSVIREDPTLLSAAGGHAPSSSGTGKLLMFLLKKA